MITLKQVDKDERWAFTVIQKFITNHPIFTFVAGFILVIFILLAVSVVMICGAVGISMVESTAHTQLVAGEISVDNYVSLLNVLNISIFFYNFVSIFIRFLVLVATFILLYIGFKEYLKYKRDNL